MFAEPKGIETQLFGPIRDGQNLLIIGLIGAIELGVIVPENEDAEFHGGYPLPRIHCDAKWP
jgi:hypothetical protein